ncbi:hypothetical protein ABFX02_03G083700 [Erythranthe guttata]
MLLAVEGGGFFSSSASGYSKGLTLLLLGHKNEEKPMRVAPWSQYHLVDQETDPNLQLASKKNGACASFVCFGRSNTGLESPSPLKVGPTENQEVSQADVVFDEIKDITHSVATMDDDDDDCDRTVFSLKSSLKKSVDSAPIADCGKDEVVTSQMERRKVQWTDTSGGQLFEIREFEMRWIRR